MTRSNSVNIKSPVCTVTFTFFDLHFDEWNKAAALPAPQVFAPGSSVCRQYFEYAFPRNTFTHDGLDAEGHKIRGSAELIDIHIKGWDLYFFQSEVSWLQQGRTGPAKASDGLTACRACRSSQTGVASLQERRSGENIEPLGVELSGHARIHTRRDRGGCAKYQPDDTASAGKIRACDGVEIGHGGHTIFHEPVGLLARSAAALQFDTHSNISRFGLRSGHVLDDQLHLEYASSFENSDRVVACAPRRCRQTNSRSEPRVCSKCGVPRTR